MSIYQRGNNWYVDFTFKGQGVRESIGPSRKDAEKVIAKKKTEIVEGKYLDIRKEPEPVKFYDFAKQYLQRAKVNHKPSSYPCLLSQIKGLNMAFEGKNLHEITTWAIEKWKAQRKEKLKPASVNRELAILKHMFTRAIEWGKVKENPAKKVKLLKGVGKRVRYLLPNEVQTLLSNCEPFLNTVVTVAVHTGMRKGELLGLQWDQVNFEQGIITISDTKNNERRDVPMDETVKSTLRSIERKGDLVFTDDQGRRINISLLHLSFHEALKKSGITDFRFHDLRHTFASSLVMEGVELNDVRELLGHKRMDMTLRYAHLSPKHKTRVVNILDRVMAQNPPQEERVIQLRR